MTQVYVQYDPYRIKTLIAINGKFISERCLLYKIVNKKEIKEWLNGFPKMLKKQCRTKNFEIEFYGTYFDWNAFEKEFCYAAEKGIINKAKIKYKKLKIDDSIQKKIVNYFSDIEESTMEGWHDYKLFKAINNIEKKIIPVFVAGAANSGKSALVKTLSQKQIMFAKTIETIPVFIEDMQSIDKTMRMLGRNPDNMFIYVMDATHLNTNDDSLLYYIADQIKKGGKQIHRRFLFVINKMDELYPGEENIKEVILAAKKFLRDHGIGNTQIFPCSAVVALNIWLYLENIDIENLTKRQTKQLPSVAGNTLSMIGQFNESEFMHLEKYTMLPSNTRKKLNSRLIQAQNQNNTKEQALIHSGIYNIEQALYEIISKYEADRINDLVDSFDNYYRTFIRKASYKILVTATMSAGKSTLINAITGKKICKSQNMACTDKLNYIIGKPFDTDFTLGYDAMLTAIVNEKEKAAGNEVDASSVYYNSILAGQRIVVCDSPGVNFSGDDKHKQITDKMVSTGNYQLMLYLMNATQLGTNDDDTHLAFVKEHIGEKPILFVMNKVDAFNEEEEDIEAIILKQIKYLESKGFFRPLVCPVSAKAGYLAKKAGNEELGRLERRELNNMEDKFEQMHLAGYYAKHYPDIVIPDSEDADKQLLKNCGISYIETIIKTFCEGGCVNGTSIR